MGIITKLGRALDPAAASVVSSRYVGFWPSFQASPDSLTTLIDRSGNGNNMVAGGSGIGGSAWSNSNVYTSATAANTGVYLSKAAAKLAAWTWTPTQRDSLVFSARVYTPNSAATDTIFRTGTANTTGGWWLETSSTGFTGSTPGARLKFYDTVTGTQDPVGFVSLPANTETSICAIIDGPGNQGFLFVDGLLAAVSTSTNPRPLVDISTMTVQQAAAADCYLGAGPSGATDVKRFRGVHLAVIPASAGAIADPYALAMRLHRHPYTQLTTRELP